MAEFVQRPTDFLAIRVFTGSQPLGYLLSVLIIQECLLMTFWLVIKTFYTMLSERLNPPEDRSDLNVEQCSDILGMMVSIGPDCK